MEIFDEELLELKIFRNYYDVKNNSNERWSENPNRNYDMLINIFNSIYEFNDNYAKSFAKKMKNQNKDLNNCEGVFSEMIVFQYYLNQLNKNLIRDIKLQEKECDIIIEENDGEKFFYEILMVKPQIRLSNKDKIIVNDLKTQTQKYMSSIRMKILNKINKQNQLIKERNNYVVIDVNESLIANDFIVLSSLSDGYKIEINTQNSKVISEGYDWKNSIFHDNKTKFLKGIKYFFAGDYDNHRTLENPYFNNKN